MTKTDAGTQKTVPAETQLLDFNGYKKFLMMIIADVLLVVTILLENLQRMTILSFDPYA